MDIQELEQRIASWEDIRTEFKLEPIHPDDLSAALVAFANAGGGDLIIGVSNDKRIAGITDADSLSQFVENVAFNNCRPPVTVKPQLVEYQGKRLMAVHIARGDQRPYATNRGVYYVRTSSGRRQASREEILRMFQATESLYYDETVLLRAEVSELDTDALRHFVISTGQSVTLLDLPPEQLLRSWRLIAEGHPTVAGMLLFGRNPQEHLPFAQVNAARIPGIELANDPSDRKDFGGKLLDIVDQSMRFLDLHLPTPHRIRGLEPEPKPELPKEALREALVNAVAHRDYTIPGPVRIFVFDDRVEFHSPGSAPNTLDESAMRAGAHIVRNPHLYARLSDAGLVTRAGSGIPRIVRLIKEAVGQDVRLAIRDFEVLLSIPRPGR